MLYLLFKKKAHRFKGQARIPSLIICLIMDFLGYATYTIPFLGELLDILWAPISAVIFMRLFGGTRGFLGGVFNFIEELLLGLDFIPTFTITWCIQYYKRNKNNITIKPLVRQ